MDVLDTLRKQIDQIDEQILTLFAGRFSLVKKIGEYKKNNNMQVLDKNREGKKLQKLIHLGNTQGVSEPFITSVWKSVFAESYKLES